MSQTIDNRIVEMQFENKQFESGVQESLSTLDKLKNALKFDDASKNLQDFSKNINKNMDLSGLSKSVEDVSSKFSASGIAGMEVIRKLTDFAIDAGKKIASALDAPFAQIRSGGWKRAMNIEDAKFQLKGLGVTWESVSDDINFAVADTAYGLDVAAKACSQLSASGLKAGDSMKAALRGISGVASMGNTEYENITQIFTKAAGNGKVMADELNRISQYGLNARAEVVKFFNDVNSGAEKLQQYEQESGIIIPEAVKRNVKAVTDGNQLIEADLADLVKHGELSFEMFSYAMDYAFGKHAKDANETFMGSLRNIKAALSKIGAEFATPLIHGAIPVFNQIRIFINTLKKEMQPIYDVFSKITGIVSDKVTDKLKRFSFAFFDLGGAERIGNALKNVFTSLVKIIAAVSNAFRSVFKPAEAVEIKVMDVTSAIEKFSKHLVISDDAAYVFRNVMVVIFNILKAVGSVLKTILPVVGKVAVAGLNIVSIIIKIVSCLTDFISRLNIVQGIMIGIQGAGGLFAYALEKIRDGFYKLRSVLTDTSTVTGQVFLKLKDAALTVAYVVGGVLYLAFMKLREAFSYFDTHDPLGSLINGINKLANLPIIGKIISGIKTAFEAVIYAISKAIEAVKTFVVQVRNGATIFEAFGSAAQVVFSGITSGFEKIKETVKGWFALFTNKERVIEETVEMPIYGANAALAGFVKEVSLTKKEVDSTSKSFGGAKSAVSSFASTVLEKIQSINVSKVILAAFAGVLLLISYNSNRLIKAMGALTRKLSGGIIGLFRVTPTKFDKFRVGLAAITGAIIALAGAIYMLKDVPADQLDRITSSLLKLIGLAGGLSLVATIIVELMTRFSGANAFSTFSSNIFMLAAGITAMIAALKLIEDMNMEGVWGKVLVLLAIGGSLTTFSIIMAKLAPQLTLGSVFMLAFAGSCYILVQALKSLSEADLTGINENWKELSVIIVSFAGFAALAGTVGITSTLSLIAFIVGLHTLLSNIDRIKDQLKQLGIADVIANFFESLKNSIKNALMWALQVYSNMSMLDKTMLGIGALLVGGGIGTLLVGVGFAAKHIKKAALSAALLAVAVAGLMFATYKIAQACKDIAPGDVIKAIAILASVGTLIGVVTALAGYFGGDVTTSGSEIFGRFGKKMVTKGEARTVRSAYMKQTRKMLLDMAILLASVALFCNVIGKLKPEELDQAAKLLRQTLIFFGALMIVITLISSHARTTVNSAASIVPFMGIIGTLGALLASFVILMNYFKDFNFSKDWPQLIAAIAILGGMVFAVIKFMNIVNKMKKFGSSWASITAIGGVILAIGIVVSQLVQVIKTPDDLKRAGIIAGGIAVFILVIMAMVIALEAFTKMLMNTQIRQAGFIKAVMGLGVMIGAILALAITFYALRNVDAGQMAKQAGIIVIVLTAISALVLAIQHFTKNKLTSITDKGGLKLRQTLAVIGIFLLAFIALAITFSAMRNVDPNNMASQMLTIIIALTALSALGLAIIHFTKTMKSDWLSMGMAAAMLAGMIGLFGILALIFKIIDGFKSTGGELIGKSQTIVLVLLELEVLALAASVLGGGGAMATDIALGELTLLGMVALFGILSLVFMAMDGLKTEGIMKKSQTLVLVLLELGVLALGCSVLGGGGVLAADIALGELTLLGMVALFGILSLVFMAIDGLKTEGIMAKSQTMVLVLLELEVLLALLGVISPLAVMALAGMPGLLGVVLAMVGIAGAIKLLESMDIARIQSTIDIFIDSLGKLLTLAIESSGAGLSLLSIAAGIAAVGVACGVAGLGLMVFSSAVTTLTIAIKALSSTGPMVMSWFASISSGIATLSSTIMNSMEGISKSVVKSVQTIIVGIAAAIVAGGSIILTAMNTVGKKIKSGFDKVLQPFKWGEEFVVNLVNGIKSKISLVTKAAASVAHAIWEYLHFTEPNKGDLKGSSEWFKHMMSNLGNSISSNMSFVIDPVKNIGTNIKNAVSGFSLDGLFDVSNMMGGKDAFLGDCTDIMRAIGMVKNELGSLNSLSMGTREDFGYGLKQEEKQLKAQREQLYKVAKEERKWGEVTSYTTNELKLNKKALEENAKKQKELFEGVEKTAEAVDDLSDSFGGMSDESKKAKGSTKEIKDEIADFYDTMSGAISLFEEFNKETELTSDQLIKNMQSQIQGVSEWADQIQKLAFMGIDQGLLQQLAEMGPQGYQYTNAFVHMTADQLAEANNLYHQSLMLPAKITSQVYGSYTVAGRSAASGFLMGMTQADLKSAAVGFAHDVVDQMNLALDIQSGKAMVTYEDGVAVVNGVKTGMSEANMGKATDLLISNDIKKKFNDGLLNNDYMYIVGKNITRGLARGVEDEDATSDLVGAVVKVCNLAKTTAEKATKEKSPSRVFMKIGNFITLGLAKGISDETQAAVDAMDTTANTIIDTMRDTINKANDALIDDIDEPVITPILDLSEVQNGSRQLDDMLSRNSAFSARRSFGNLQNEQWNSQNALLNATMDNTDIVSAVTSLNEEVATLKDVMANIKVVLDTGTMVGAMTPAIDQQLGMRQVLAGRGI